MGHCYRADPEGTLPYSGLDTDDQGPAMNTACSAALQRNGQAASWKWFGKGGHQPGRGSDVKVLDFVSTLRDFHMDDYGNLLFYLLPLSTAGGPTCGLSDLLQRQNP